MDRQPAEDALDWVTDYSSQVRHSFFLQRLDSCIIHIECNRRGGGWRQPSAARNNLSSLLIIRGICLQKHKEYDYTCLWNFCCFIFAYCTCNSDVVVKCAAALSFLTTIIIIIACLEFVAKNKAPNYKETCIAFSGEQIVFSHLYFYFNSPNLPTPNPLNNIYYHTIRKNF